MTLRNIPRRQFLDPLPPSAHVVHRCRVCDFTETGWCAVNDPRIVVGLCLECAANREPSRFDRLYRSAENVEKDRARRIERLEVLTMEAMCDEDRGYLLTSPEFGCVHWEAKG